jgi:hypothetical protein
MPISYITAASLDGTQNGSAPIYGARAWVNFNGTGTVAIRASGNVTSITDNGTGDYTVNFATAMPDVNYSPIPSTNGVVSGSRYASIDSQTTSGVRLKMYSDANAGFNDVSQVSVAIFR